MAIKKEKPTEMVRPETLEVLRRFKENMDEKGNFADPTALAMNGDYINLLNMVTRDKKFAKVLNEAISGGLEAGMDGVTSHGDKIAIDAGDLKITNRELKNMYYKALIRSPQAEVGNILLSLPEMLATKGSRKQSEFMVMLSTPGTGKSTVLDALSRGLLLTLVQVSDAIREGGLKSQRARDAVGTFYKLFRPVLESAIGTDAADNFYKEKNFNKFIDKFLEGASSYLTSINKSDEVTAGFFEHAYRGESMTLDTSKKDMSQLQNMVKSTKANKKSVLELASVIPRFPVAMVDDAHVNNLPDAVTAVLHDVASPASQIPALMVMAMNPGASGDFLDKAIRGGEAEAKAKGEHQEGLRERLAFFVPVVREDQEGMPSITDQTKAVTRNFTKNSLVALLLLHKLDASKITQDDIDRKRKTFKSLYKGEATQKRIDKMFDITPKDLQLMKDDLNNLLDRWFETEEDKKAFNELAEELAGHLPNNNSIFSTYFMTLVDYLNPHNVGGMLLEAAETRNTDPKMIRYSTDTLLGTILSRNKNLSPEERKKTKRILQRKLNKLAINRVNLLGNVEPHEIGNEDVANIAIEEGSKELDILENDEIPTEQIEEIDNKGLQTKTNEHAEKIGKRLNSIKERINKFLNSNSKDAQDAIAMLPTEQSPYGNSLRRVIKEISPSSFSEAIKILENGFELHTRDVCEKKPAGSIANKVTTSRRMAALMTRLEGIHNRHKEGVITKEVRDAKIMELTHKVFGPNHIISRAILDEYGVGSTFNPDNPKDVVNMFGEIGPELLEKVIRHGTGEDVSFTDEELQKVQMFADKLSIFGGSTKKSVDMNDLLVESLTHYFNSIASSVGEDGLNTDVHENPLKNMHMLFTQKFNKRKALDGLFNGLNNLIGFNDQKSKEKMNIFRNSYNKFLSEYDETGELSLTEDNPVMIDAENAKNAGGLSQVGEFNSDLAKTLRDICSKIGGEGGENIAGHISRAIADSFTNIEGVGSLPFHILTKFHK